MINLFWLFTVVYFLSRNHVQCFAAGGYQSTLIKPETFSLELKQTQLTHTIQSCKGRFNQSLVRFEPMPFNSVFMTKCMYNVYHFQQIIFRVILERWKRMSG